MQKLKDKYPDVDDPSFQNVVTLTTNTINPIVINRKYKGKSLTCKAVHCC